MLKAPQKYTDHAWQRRNQRCKRQRPIELILEYGDIDIHRGRDVWALSISETDAEGLVDDGLMTRADADSVRGLVLLIAEADWMMVTVLKDSRKRLGAYRSAA